MIGALTQPESFDFFVELEKWVRAVGPTGILSVLVWVLWRKLDAYEDRATKASLERDTRIDQLQKEQAKFYIEYRDWADKALEIVVDAKIVMQRMLDRLNDKNIK